MVMVFFKSQYVRIASLFEAKNLHLGANLSELSHSSKDWVKIASLRCKSDVKVLLKYMISPKQIAKNNSFNCKTSYSTLQIKSLCKNNLPATMRDKLAKLH